MTKINMTDKYQTKDGREVRILCVDLKGTQPVVAVISKKNGHEHTCQFTEEGYYRASRIPADIDLIPVPKEYWVNLYEEGGTVTTHTSREEADKHAYDTRIACLKFKEGDGL